MLTRLFPFQFDRPASGGTRPARITAETDSGEIVEVVAKLTATCDRGENSLAMEVVSALLAADLQLPIPQPFLVEMDEVWISSISDIAWRDAAFASNRLAFGSKALQRGYPEWIPGTPLIGGMAANAAAIFAFDAFIDNNDRGEGNPNCLARGEEIRIIDHERAFPDNRGIVGWLPPWTIGGLNHLKTPGRHIFKGGLSRAQVDWDVIGSQWNSLPAQRIESYADAIPNEWSAAHAAVQYAIERIKSVREHIDDCILELKRVLYD